MIEVDHLSRYYGQHRAVDDVSFQIGDNTVVGFLGLNGAGKTTTLKVIAGLLPPSAGTVRVDGVDMATAPESFRKSIGFWPETPPRYVEQTVTEFLRFVGQLRGVAAAEVERRIPEVIERCQLKGREHWVIDELSHGYRKRVGIPATILHKPKLVILDEPISGLDPEQIIEMRKVIRDLGKECTVLVSSHILPEVRQTCDRVLVLRKGRIVYAGTERDLHSHGEGHLVRVGVRGASADLLAVLRGMPNVRSATVEGEADGVVDVLVSLIGDQREELIAALVGAGQRVRRVEDARDDLEQTFLDLTREGAA